MRTVSDWLEFKPSETVPVSAEGLRSDHHVAVKVAPIITHLRGTGAIRGSMEDEETIKRLTALCLEVLAEKQFAGTAQPGAEMVYLNVVVHRLIAAYEKLARPPAMADSEPRVTELGTFTMRNKVVLDVRWNHTTGRLDTRPATPQHRQSQMGWSQIDTERWYPEEARALREMEARVAK